MKLRHIFGSLFLLVAASVMPAKAAIIVSDDFESYADTAAMKAVWGGAGNLGTLDTSLAFSGTKSAAHPGGTVNTYLPGIGSATPSTTEDLVLSGRIYDNAVDNRDRITIGLRTGANPLFEMGRYLDSTIGFAEGFPYGARVLSMGNGITPSPNWKPFLSGGNPIASVAGWHTYEATFSIANGVKITLDLGSDGTIDSTLQFAGDGVTPFGNFTDLRFGGPSNLSSAGGGANFDDIRLEYVPVIPEPTSVALISLIGVALAGMRIRR